VELKHGTTVMISSVYDEYGKQTSLTDKNAGTISYQYDAFGQLVQQTDALSNTYTMLYDDLGRIVSRTGTEGATTYEYYKKGRFSTICSNNQLTKVTGFNGVVKQYAYDNYLRLQSEKVTVDGIDYTTSYNYDQYSNLTATTYPTGMVVSSTFDQTGELLTTGYNYNQWGYHNLFTANAFNGFGQCTNYTLGNGLTTQNDYQYGLPTRTYTPGNWYFPNGVQDNHYTYDFNTGNLLSRSDAVYSQVENFQYDPLNRLTTSTVNGIQQLSINYDVNTSFSMGNIASKTDAGNYVYKNDKVHAVAYITNPAGATAPPISIPSTGQYITYTPFLKTSLIAEGNKQIQFTYGPDYERVKTELGNTTIYEPETRLFLGNYEKQVKFGQWHNEIHYVSAGNGVSTMVVVENGTVNPYYVYSDYLGSPQVITNHNATQAWRQNFDAWGRHRDPANWNTQLAATATPNVPNWLYRGYTGHEHLPDFALINMNGRMYDPIQGRMISPDNYVPDPWNTQGYNRYSYANNNPLKYTDPDGNFIVAAALIAGFINWVSHGGEFSFKGLGNFAIGSATSLIGSGIGAGLAGSFLNTGLVGSGFISGAISGSFTGAINAVINGGDFGKGALKGGLSGGLVGAAQGLFQRISLSGSEFLITEDGSQQLVSFANDAELDQYITNNIGNVNTIESALQTDIYLANSGNIASEYSFSNSLIYKTVNGKQVIVGGYTAPKGGYLTKLKSEILISPGLKGLSNSGVNLSSMVINHEFLHSYHLYKGLSNYNLYSERATSAYSLAYAKAYKMSTNLINSFRANVKGYPASYSWKNLIGLLKLGIQ